MSTPPTLRRHLGLFQATALNVTWIVGAGVFAMIPQMVAKLPGPYALLGWLVAGVVMLCDGLVWSELGAAMPGSGGSYLYLLECFGRERWGRLMAFLFIWQILLSGPLEIASGLIAMAEFSSAFSDGFRSFNEHYTISHMFFADSKVGVTFGPARVLAILAGCLILYLLHRRIEGLGRLTVTLWLGVLFVIGWLLFEGALRFDPAVAFAWTDSAGKTAEFSWNGLGSATRFAMYAYFGYYGICYLGDEVRSPGRTIPRSILLSAAIVAVLFIGLHVAMLGVVPWGSIPTKEAELDDFSLAAVFMRKIHGHWAVVLVTLCLIWSCFGSVFAGLLGYSRIPYGAARFGHFFAPFAKVHETLAIPHVSLWLVGLLSLAWSLFDLQTVIDALVTMRIIEQFIAQTIGVMLLRRLQPDRPRPFRIWLYPVPCLLALIGWGYMYASAGWLFIGLGLCTLLLGIVAFLIWSWRGRAWPFTPASTAGSVL